MLCSKQIISALSDVSRLENDFTEQRKAAPITQAHVTMRDDTNTPH